MSVSEANLGEFLSWAVVTGVTEMRIPDFRRVALELIKEAGGGEVTEGHILHLIDIYADLPGGREIGTLIEEVGESLLRFQASRPAPPVVVPNTTPTRGVPIPQVKTSSQPFVARPEDRTAGDLMPPAVPRHTPPEQPVVSFAQATPAPAPPAPRVRSTNRRSAVQFRCVHCRMMVTADENMACPRCGRRAPSISMPAARRPAGRAWLLPAALFGVVVALVALLVPRLFSSWFDRSESVAGVYASPHLGVKLQFPAGWRHITDGDHAPAAALEGLEPAVPDALSLRLSRFRHDREALHVVTAARPSQVTDAALASWAETVVARPEAVVPALRDVLELADLRLGACEAGPTVPRSGLRCSGEASRARVVVYVWGSRGVTWIAAYLTADMAESVTRSDEIIAGLDVN